MSREVASGCQSPEYKALAGIQPERKSQRWGESPVHRRNNPDLQRRLWPDDRQQAKKRQAQRKRVTSTPGNRRSNFHNRHCERRTTGGAGNPSRGYRNRHTRMSMRSRPSDQTGSCEISSERNLLSWGWQGHGATLVRSVGGGRNPFRFGGGSKPASSASAVPLPYTVIMRCKLRGSNRRMEESCARRRN